MSELEAEAVVVNKKPIWKNRTVWIIGILVVLFIAYKVGSSPSVPEGIEEKHYEQALGAFHELNVAFEKGEYPSHDVISWVTDHASIIERDASDYTEKEIYINGQLTKMLLGVGSIQDFGENRGFEEQVYEARSNLADVLEVDENY